MACHWRTNKGVNNRRTAGDVGGGGRGRTTNATIPGLNVYYWWGDRKGKQLRTTQPFSYKKTQAQERHLHGTHVPAELDPASALTRYWKKAEVSKESRAAAAAASLPFIFTPADFLTIVR